MFSNNLKRIRLSKGMTKKELALACAVSPMAISFYESGQRKPTVDNALKIARSLNVRFEDLMDDSEQKLCFNHGKYRKNSGLTKRIQELATSTIEEYFNRFFSVLSILGRNVISEPHKVQSIAATNNIEYDAQLLRKELNFPTTGAIENITDHLESVGILTVLVDIDDRGFSGLNGMVDDYPYIAVNKNMTAERIRSTIIHELAHIMFKEDSINFADGEEKFATAVAGAFLMPFESLKKDFGMYRTKLAKDMVMTCKKYGISMFLLIKRAYSCKLISESIEKSFYISLSRLGWRKNEPSRIKAESPRLLQQLVLRALGEEEISKERACELLNCTDNELDLMIIFS